MRARVVLIPGLMGSALQDATRSLQEAQELCAKHWEIYPRLKKNLEERGNNLCNDDSNVIWGRLQFLHWLADIKDWLALMSKGDGYSTPGGILPKGLTEFALRLNKGRTIEFRPYAALSDRLKRAGFDLLVFPYDWRLRVNDAASRLEAAILKRWWPNGLPKAAVADDDRVVLIGHSLGGLVARLFVEDPIYSGYGLTRRVILIATPNRGAPVAYAYFTGAKSLFKDSAIWSTLRSIHDSQPREAQPSAYASPGSAGPPIANPNFQIWSSREMSTSMLTREEELDLVQSFASICQLLPNYDFVERKSGGKEKWHDTYKYEWHHKMHRHVAEILAEMSDRLKEPRTLDDWLNDNRIEYNIIGSTQLPTVTGLKQAPTKSRYTLITTKKAGDGTVPTFSSLDWARQEKDLRRISFFEPSPKSKFAIHAELCRHPQVIENCVAWSKQTIKSTITGTETPTRMMRGNVQQYLRVARDIFLSGREPIRRLPKNQTQVISFALLEGVIDNVPLIDAETFVDMNGLRRLKNPIPGIDRSAVVYSGRTGSMKYDFVLLVGNSNWPGGVLFLPEKDEGWLHVFGIITTPWEYNCSNGGHAEMQFRHWFAAQRSNRAWHKNVYRLHMWNENLNRKNHDDRPKDCAHTENWGYSPCAGCCVDLADLWWPENAGPRVMHWTTLYRGREKCHNGTTSTSLKRMTDAGWLVYGCMPPAPQPQLQTTKPTGQVTPS